MLAGGVLLVLLQRRNTQLFVGNIESDRAAVSEPVWRENHEWTHAA